MKKPSKAFMGNKLVKSPFNPSVSATKRVTDKLPVPTQCPKCNGKVACVTNELVYGRELGEYPWIYICTKCDMYTGLHPWTNIPVGTLADKPTREARKKGKKPFNLMVDNLGRKKAYKTLANLMGIPTSECHFGWFDVAQCVHAQECCEIHLKNQEKYL